MPLKSIRYYERLLKIKLKNNVIAVIGIFLSICILLRTPLLISTDNNASSTSGSQNLKYLSNEWHEPDIGDRFRSVPGQKPIIEDIEKIAIEWSPEKLQYLLENLTSKCRRLISLGGKYDCRSCSRQCMKDGHKFLCLDEDVRPKPKSCIVYSFGIGENLSFDRAIARYNCRVFAFDNDANIQGKKLNENIHFLRLGLYKVDVEASYKLLHESTNTLRFMNASMRTLGTIIGLLDHNNDRIDYLKMDIEFGEWNFFEYVFQNEENKKFLQKISQIAIEIHLDDFKNRTTSQRVTGAVRYERALGNLKNANFQLVKSDPNAFSQYLADVVGITFPTFRESLYVRRTL